jgi:hypothetical protein
MTLPLNEPTSDTTDSPLFSLVPVSDLLEGGPTPMATATAPTTIVTPPPFQNGFYDRVDLEWFQRAIPGLFEVAELNTEDQLTEFLRETGEADLRCMAFAESVIPFEYDVTRDAVRAVAMLVYHGHGFDKTQLFSIIDEMKRVVEDSTVTNGMIDIGIVLPKEQPTVPSDAVRGAAVRFDSRGPGKLKNPALQ